MLFNQDMHNLAMSKQPITIRSCISSWSLEVVVMYTHIRSC